MIPAGGNSNSSSPPLSPIKSNSVTVNNIHANTNALTNGGGSSNGNSRTYLSVTFHFSLYTLLSFFFVAWMFSLHFPSNLHMEKKENLIPLRLMQIESTDRLPCLSNVQLHPHSTHILRMTPAYDMNDV